MIRKILKGWLGIGALEFQTGRMAQSLSTDRKAIDELTDSVAKCRGAVSRNDERVGDLAKNLTGHQQWHGERMQMVEERVLRLESPQQESPDEPVGEPIACPRCGRAGLVRAAAIEAVDRAHPDRTRIVGYGLACPKCKHAFYWQQGADGIGKTWASDEKLDDDAAAQVGAPDPPARAETVPKVRWSGPRGRRA